VDDRYGEVLYYPWASRQHRRFEGILGIYPTQVWYYYGNAKKGLPPHFVIVFFQKGGAGEYRLYDPISDGPASLMVHTEGIAI